MQLKKRAILGQFTDMDLRLLRVFKSVVDCGGMAAAELELNIGVSTISKHIKDLETRLGLTLCHRGRAGFSITPEGLLIYQETINLLAATEAFKKTVDDAHERLGGQLHIAVFEHSSTNPQSHIGKAIALFTDLAPDVNLQMYVEPINTIERGIIAGHFQLGIIPQHRNGESLQYFHLFNETMQMYCGQTHSLYHQDQHGLTWKNIQEYAFAGLGYHSPNMLVSKQAHLTQSAAGFAQESIATLILSGKYLGFLPDHFAETFEQKKLMKVVQPHLFKYECNFAAVIRRSPNPDRITRLFLDCLLQAHQ